MPPPKGEAFDHERYAQTRLSIIDDLLRKFDH